VSPARTAINDLINRRNTCPITDTNKNYELKHIRTILRNNIYPTCKNVKKQKTNHTGKTPPGDKQKQKWATFTYIGKESRAIKQTNIIQDHKYDKNNLKQKKLQKLSTKVAFTRHKFLNTL
jgi:hypothetical protein